MMRRTPLRSRPPVRPQRPDRSAEFASWNPTPLHRGVYAQATLTAAPKSPEPVRDDGYRRLVAALPCAYCGAVGASQVAHGNRGKGMALKTCDLTAFPACHVGANNCHGRHDAYQMGGAEAQAEREPLLAARTQQALIRLAETDPKARRVLERVGLLMLEGVEA